MGRAAPVALVLALALGAIGPAAAQNPLEQVTSLGAAPGYQGVEPGKIYKFDLDTRAFQAALPFDVNFFVQGSVGDGYEQLNARFVEFRRPPNCPSFFQPVEILLARGDEVVTGDGIPVRVRRPARAVEATPLLQAVLFGADGSRKFRIEFPPLRPNRYYCFEFISRRKVPEDELAELRGKFITALDNELRAEERREALGPDRTIFAVETLADYEELRATLIGLLEDQLDPGQTLLAPKGSFFQVDTPFDEIARNYREQFDRILEKSVDQRFDAIRNFNSKLDGANRAIRTLATTRFPTAAGERTLESLLNDPPQNAGQVESGLESVEQRTQIDLLDLLRSAAVAGFEAVSAPSFDDLWRESEFTNLDDTFVELQRVSVAISELPGLAGMAGIDEAQLELTSTAPLLGATTGGPRIIRPGERDATAAAARARVKTLADLAEDAVDDLGDNTADSSGATLQLFNLRRGLKQREELLEAVTRQLFVEIREVVRVSGTTVADFDTRARWYMSADIGGGYAWDTEDVFTYIGWNLYLRPVNKKSHLSWRARPFGLRDEFLRRFAITLGLVWDGFEEQDGQFKGVVGSRAAVLGAGFRINDAVRLSVGGLFFENENPDPLISSTSLNWTPYAAISFDWNATKTFAGIFSNFGGGGATQVVTPASQ